MSTVLDKKLLPKVKSIIEKYGKILTFRVEGAKVYDPSTGTSTSSVLEYDVKATPPEAFALEYVNGDSIKASDLQTTVAAQDLKFEPINSMPVIIDGETFRIVSVTKVYSGNDICAYTLQLRI